MCTLVRMSLLTSARPGLHLRQARFAVAALFFTNGALFANLIPRYPQIKADLGLSNAVYGLSVAAFPTGAIVAGLAAGVLVRRFGSATVATAGTLLTAAGVLLAGVAPSVVLFAAVLFLAGAMDAITDVAQNAHGLRVQREYRRSIINSFHAIWSIGAVTGGAMAAAAIALDLPRSVHLTISGALFVLVAFVARRFCLPGPESPTPPEATGPRVARAAVGPRIWLVVGALVLIAMGGTLVEDAGNSWAAVYLSGSLDAAAAVAAWGYIALVGAQFVGRLIGDRLVDRFGQRTVARAGGVIVAAGMGLALAVPTVPGTILGFAAAGFGVATLVPAAMHEADELPGLRPGTGLTVVSWLMRLGFLLSPPVVGAVADATSLRAGLLVVPFAGVLVILLAGVLQPRRPQTRTTPQTAPR
jgi:MFS family permease